jgi:predicted ATP-binding protein involved in virulence
MDENDKNLNVNQLSQGEKSLMALVGDIARRLAMMNPKLDNPLLGKGIILIDEIDMHLHPQWQRSIIQRLQTTFPNCQFILTTHSPLVISDTQNILVYDLDGQEVNALPSLYGQDAIRYYCNTWIQVIVILKLLSKSAKQWMQSKIMILNLQTN